MKNPFIISSIFFTLFASGSVYANSNNYLKAGVKEFSLQGLVDLDADDSYSVDLNSKYGYFIKDNWEVGGSIATDLSKSYKSFGLGLFTQYNFTNTTNFVPYIGIATELINVDYDQKIKDLESKSFDVTAINFKASLGVKYFIRANIALTAEVNYNIATDNLKISGGDAKDSFTKFLIGTSFYF